MVYEMRVYTLQPGKTAAFQELIEKEALPVISKYSKLVGWWSTEVGPLNEVVHIWAFEDLNHRRSRPQGPGRGPSASGVSPQGAGMIVSHYNKILLPANFSPLK
jgi:hypothetical protein